MKQHFNKSDGRVLAVVQAAPALLFPNYSLNILIWCFLDAFVIMVHASVPRESVLCVTVYACLHVYTGNEMVHVQITRLQTL